MTILQFLLVISGFMAALVVGVLYAWVRSSGNGPTSPHNRMPGDDE